MDLEKVIDIVGWVGFGSGLAIGGSWIASSLYGIYKEYKEMQEIKWIFTKATIKDTIMKERNKIISRNRYNEVGLN